MASVLSVNVGRAKRVSTHLTAIDKRPVAGSVAVRALGLAGDEQADTKSHGGLDQAVYAYAIEDLQLWAARLERELKFGEFGENLSTSGIDVTNAVIGETWRVGECLLQVSCPRIPCVVFQDWLVESQWVKRFTAEGRPGAYLRVLEEGAIEAGDQISIEGRPAHGVTIGIAFRAATTEPALLPRLLEAPELSTRVRDYALRKAASAG